MAAPVKVIAKNKKAFFDYEVIEKIEAGMVLNGSEVKSIKGGHVQMKGSFVQIVGGRPILEKMHISPYPYSNQKELDPLRRRHVLLNKKEIETIAGYTEQEGLTVVPLEIYIKNGFIKLLIGVCRGKKLHDKRAVLKGRAVSRDIEKGLKRFGR